MCSGRNGCLHNLEQDRQTGDARRLPSLSLLAPVPIPVLWL